MDSEVRERTISWLDASQSRGSFDGYDEETKDFNNCSDSEIEWYFLNWFFTDGLIDDLDKFELIENYIDELKERERLLKNE